MNIPSTLNPNPIQSLYFSLFRQATSRRWFQDVIAIDDALKEVRRGLELVDLPTKDFDDRRALIDETIENMTTPFHFFDLIITLRHFFRNINGCPASIIAQGAITAMVEAWPVPFTQGSIQLAYGFTHHLSEGVAPRDLSQFELACVMLKPALSPGMLVLHQQSGIYGCIESVHDLNAIQWRPNKAPSSDAPLVEADYHTFLPVTPAITAIPLSLSDPFPRVTKEHVRTAFERYYPAS